MTVTGLKSTSCLMFWSVCCLGLVRGADPVLTPPTLTDGNNTANSDSTITWGNIPEGKEYQADAGYEDGGMGPLFDFARSFINTALPNGFPSDLIRDFMNGDFDISTDYIKIAEEFPGYGACIVIGLLFIIIFTLVGVFFWGCRYLGYCGGQTFQKPSPNSSCRRKVYGVVLFVLVVFTGVGAICVCVSNDRISSSLERYGPTVSTNMDDMTSFVDNTVAQINHLLKNDLDFTFDVVHRDLDNIDVLVGIPVRENLDANINAKVLFDQVAALQTDVSKAITEFDAVDQNVTDFKNNFTAFKTEFDQWIIDYENDRTTACGGTTCTGFPDANYLSTTIDPAQINIENATTEIDKIRSQDMGALVSTARDEFDNITERVKNESKTPIQDIKNDINSYKDEITPITDSINDLQNYLHRSIDLEDITAQVTLYTEEIQQCDQLRWYGGVGLACIAILIVVLQFIGLAFGVYGSAYDTVPTERTRLSNSGGNMLMAAVGFIFLFSWMFMCLTMLCFMLGAPMERYFCQSLSDPELTSFNQIFTEVEKLKPSTGTGSWLGETILNDSSVDLTFQGILGDCKEGKTAYSAFSLENLDGFNLTTVTNYKNSIDIETQLNAINVDWTQVEVAPQSLKDNLDDFKASVDNMNFTNYNDELNKDVSGSDLTAFMTDFKNKLDGMPPVAARTTLEARYTDLVAIRDGSYANTITAKDELTNSMSTLETSFSDLPTKIDDLKTRLVSVETAGNAILQGVLGSYTQRIFSIVDSLIARAVNGLKDDIAKCTPIYNLYQSVIVIGMCKYILDAFNGFWFSLGWCIFFFVPSTIFAVKLAKYYRRMTFLNDCESTVQSKINDCIRNGRNKVSPLDSLEEEMETDTENNPESGTSPSPMTTENTGAIISSAPKASVSEQIEILAYPIYKRGI